MFGLEYLISTIKRLCQLGYAIVSAIPFYFCWNCIAPKYLTAWVPPIFINLPYWHIVAFFIVIVILSDYLGSFTKNLLPKIVSITQKNEKGTNEG